MHLVEGNFLLVPDKRMGCKKEGGVLLDGCYNFSPSVPICVSEEQQKC